MKSIIACLIIAASTLSPAYAQVTARQGNSPAADQVQRFSGSMEIEVPFAAAHPYTWNAVVTTKEDLTKFVCDGVYIEKLSFRPVKAKKGLLKVFVSAKFVNQPGMDKLADARLAVIDGEKALATSNQWLGLDVEEGKWNVPKEAVLTIPIVQLRTDPYPKLRISITVRDNP